MFGVICPLLDVELTDPLVPDGAIGCLESRIRRGKEKRKKKRYK